MRVRAARSQRLLITVSGSDSRTAGVLRRCARHALAREGRGAGRVEIVIVADRAMRAAHGRWRGSAASTDVLTFDLTGGRGRTIDGVIMVCRDMARREAARRRTSVVAELRLYVVHGCLHLVGYDDRRRGDFLRMHRREDELLAELGCGPVFARRPASGSGAS